MKKILLCIFLTYGTAGATEKIDILKMFEHFALASAAVSKCIKPEKADLSSFLANYQMISFLVAKEIKNRKPNFSKSQISSIMKVGSEKTTTAVHAVIEKEGCESPKIQDLIKRFHVQAKWKP